MWTPNRRQLLVAGGAAASAALLRPAGAQVKTLRPFRVGVVLPAKTGLSTVRTSITDYAGEAGRMGTILAEGKIGDPASAAGWHLEVLQANSPSADAAKRAGERLAATGNICALVGGVGDGQAEVLSAIAEKARIPFFNIGSPNDALRNAACGRYTFHIEASAAMYLDMLVTWSAAKGQKRWFVVHEDNDAGKRLLQRATKSIATFGAGGTVVASAAVKREAPAYINELNAAGRSGADVFLMLLNGSDQIAFLGNMDDMGLPAAVVALPDAVTQTRDYIVSARYLAPGTNPRYRPTAWDCTMTANGAAEFNNSFLLRWSFPADPTGWAAFSAIKMVFQAAQATNSLDGPTVAKYLEAPGTTFDLGKGPGVSFRPWDHQLRQPLYMIKVDQDVEWQREEIPTWIALASVGAEFPAANQTGTAIERLDRFGDGATGSACKF